MEHNVHFRPCGGEAKLREALTKIVAIGECECTHDDENCCVKVGEPCPTCIAAAALAQPAPVTAERAAVDDRARMLAERIYSEPSVEVAAELISAELRAARARALEDAIIPVRELPTRDAIIDAIRAVVERLRERTK